MNYTIPDKPADDKPRYVRVTDPVEIEAIQRAGLRDPIGDKHTGFWYAEAHSLAQFRGQPVEIDV
jgi:hypothetical protein